MSFFPLRLVHEHFDSLEGLLVREQSLSFDRRLVGGQLARVQERMQAHLAGLDHRLEESLAVANSRLYARSAPSRAAAAWTLVRLAPGRLPVRSKREVGFAVIDTLIQHGLVQGSPELVAAQQQVTRPHELDNALVSSDTEVAFIALAAASALGRKSALATALKVLSHPTDAGLTRMAVFAVGRSLSRGPTDAGPAGVLEALLGEQITTIPGLPILAALFGHWPTALRLENCAVHGKTAQLREQCVVGLGLLGLERSIPLLRELANDMDHHHPNLHLAARRALSQMTGGGVGVADDGQRIISDTCIVELHESRGPMARWFCGAPAVGHGSACLSPAQVYWRSLWDGSVVRLPWEVLLHGRVPASFWSSLA